MAGLGSEPVLSSSRLRAVTSRSALEQHLGAELAPAEVTRRRVLTLTVAVIGAALLAWSLRLPAADPRFVPGTLAVAAVWLVGALVTGRALRRRSEAGRRDAIHRISLGFITGMVLLVIFLLGTSLVAQLPVLREPVEALLAHAHWGRLPTVTFITALSGVVEELFFRGALYDAFITGRPVLVSTVVYTVVTALSGIWLLALAALLLGLATAALRRLTGGVLAPIAAHLVWSLGMLFTLEPVLNLWK